MSKQVLRHDWEFKFPRECSHQGWDINKWYRLARGLMMWKGK